jgi:4-hydroxybenzoate polyprenyltransferase
MKLLICAYLNLFRWPNLCIIAVSQLLVRKFILGLSFSSLVFWPIDTAFYFILMSTVFIAAAGYVINDYFDIKIDLVNKPSRVYIGRIIKRRNALLLHQTLSFLGLMCSVFVGFKMVLISLVSIVLLWFYASVFKKKPFVGNFIVAFLIALSILQLGLFYQKHIYLICIYAIFAFFINLIRELIKDMQDLPGDRMHGAMTLPVVWGIRKTKETIYGLVFVFFVLLSAMASTYEHSKLKFVFLIVGGLLVFFIYKVYYADRTQHFKELSNLSKIIMLLGMSSMVLI